MTRLMFGTGIGVVIFGYFVFTFALMGMGALANLFLSGVITSLLYWKFVFHNVTFIVPANKCWIMSNTFWKESKVYDPAFGGYRIIQAQWEAQAGFHFKFPWDEKTEPEVDMQRIIPIEGDPKEPYTFPSGKTIHVKWLINMVPLPGRVVNFRRIKEEDIKRRVGAYAKAYLQDCIGGMDDSVGFGEAAKNQIKAGFVNLLGGPGAIHPEEEAMGIWTGAPEIYDIDQPKEVVDFRSFEMGMESVIRVANNMVTASGGKMTYPEAFKLALVGKGNAKIDFVDLAGFVGAGAALGGKKKPTTKTP